MMRNLILRATVISFVLVVLSSANLAQVVSARAGVVRKVDGGVFYRCRDNPKEFKVLSSISILHNNDSILTAETGSVLLGLNPDSFLFIDGNSSIKVKNTDLGEMHFDIERGEVFLILKSLDNGASLLIHTPPGILTIYKAGKYRVLVQQGGNTEANVLKGEIRYFESDGELVRIKKGRQVNFVRKTLFSDENSGVHN